jgi:hypothetical protein
VRWMLPGIILTFAPALHAQSLVFSGALEWIAPESISIRLSDGRIIDALLPKSGPLAAAPLSAGRHVGDSVEITCRRIPRVYDQRVDLYRYLELKELRVLRQSQPPGELAKALASKGWRDGSGQNLLRPPTDIKLNLPREPVPAEGNATDAQTMLARARTANVQLGRRLPNFVVDESVTRYRRSVGASQWIYVDKIESEATILGSKESRQRIVKDGKAWTEPFGALPGFRWFDGFGGDLRPAFACSTTTFEPEGPQSTGGKTVWLYRYSSPPDGCFGYFDSLYQRFFPARTGRVMVDASTGELLRLEQKVTGFPSEFPFVEFDKEIAWDNVTIGDTSYLLPVATNFLVQVQGTEWTVKAEYKNHRHFEASSRINYR